MIRIFGHYILKSIIYLALVEAVLLVVALRLGADLRLYVANIQADSATPGIGQYIVFVGAIQVTMLALGLYQRDTCRDIRQTLNTLFVVAVLSAGIIATIFFLVPGLALWRSMFVSGMIVALGFLFLTRVSFLRFVDRERIRKKVLVLGAGKFAQRIAHVGNERRQIGFTCEGFYRLPGETALLADAKDLGDIDDLVSFCIAHSIDEIVTAPDNSSTELPLEALLACKASGANIVHYTRFLEREEGRVDVDALREEWLIYGHNPARGSVQKALKRLLDVVLSIVLLAITLPIMMIAYAAIRITSRGPGFFKQERTGLNGQPFTLVKFRSMRLDAEKDGVPKWAQENDPRITPVGRVIRALRIDELPQIYNVLRGDMSFVGPRPERPYFVEQLSQEIPFYQYRHGVRPGITGWAQVKFSYGASVEDSKAKLGYDLYYVRQANLFLDLLVLIKTIRVILFGVGAR